MNKYWYVLAVLLVCSLWLSSPMRAYSTPSLAPNIVLGTGFTYQGQLKDSSGSPINSTCNFIFSLWDAASGGSQIGADDTVSGVVVIGGYFSVVINPGGGTGLPPFDNANARWLEIKVQCPGDPGYTTLSPRQQITYTPPTHEHSGQTWNSNGHGLMLNGSGSGLYAISPNVGVRGIGSASTGFSWGVIGSTGADQGTGVYGDAYSTDGYSTVGVFGRSASMSGRGVFGYASSTTGTNYGVWGSSESTDGRGLYGKAVATNGTNYGVYGETNSEYGYGGYFIGPARGVVGEATTSYGWGVYGHASSTDASLGGGWGVVGLSESSVGRGVMGVASATFGYTMGVYGRSDSIITGFGVFGEASSTTGENIGVWGQAYSPDGMGVYGRSIATTGENYGVFGENDSSIGIGVYGLGTATSGANFGVYGRSDSNPGIGVYGYSSSLTGNTRGVFGKIESNSGFGVYGVANNTTGFISGVRGESYSTDGRGVLGWALATTGSGVGVYGLTSSPTGYAGYFSGDVHVIGDLSASGTKPFKIDHPLDPADQFLFHYSVESPEVLNQYTGNVNLDADGEAWVELPAWFEALNTDFRYQLTPIGGFAPLYVAQKIQDNRFLIAGGLPGMEVSWEVTALRNDPYLQQNPQPVEQPKPPEQQGLYLRPELYGQPAEQGIGYIAPPETEQPLPDTHRHVE